MRIGGSLFLIAVGAILRFAVSDSVSGVDLGMVGVILMVVGALGLIISLVLMTRRRRTDIVHEPAAAYADPRYAADPRYKAPGAAGGRTTYVEDRDPRL